MTKLHFKPNFIDAIQKGKKTSTLRRWKTPRAVAGQRIFAPRIGWLHVLRCDAVQLHELLESDAQADGFDSLATLFAALGRIYPLHLVDGKRWFRVAFRLEDAQDSSGGHPSQPVSLEPLLPRKTRPSPGTARLHVARQMRLELDKAVQQSGSLFPL